MKQQHIVIQIVLVLIVLLVPTILLAQAPVGGGDPELAPIDGGLSLLVAAGVGYGAKKLKEKREKNSSNL